MGGIFLTVVAILTVCFSIKFLAPLLEWLKPWMQKRRSARQRVESAEERELHQAALSQFVRPAQADEDFHKIRERLFWREQIGVARQLNLITMVSAMVAFGGLLFLWLTVRAAQQATVEDNRAWIIPASFNTDRSVGYGPIKGLILLENIGKEPALGVEGFANTVDKTVPIEGPSPIEVGPTLEGPPILYPIKNIDFIWQKSLGFDKNACKKAIEDVDADQNGFATAIYPVPAQGVIFYAQPDRTAKLESLARQNTVVIIYGCVRYQTFNQFHFTLFCRFLEPDDARAMDDWSWASCPILNSAD